MDSEYDMCPFSGSEPVPPGELVLHGFNGGAMTMDEPPAPPAPLPPPKIEVPRLPGYLEGPVTGLVQTEKLVYGNGAKRDSAGVLGLGLPKLSSDQAMLIQRAKKYAMEVSIKMVLMKQTLAHQQQQTKYLQRQQAVSIMSRIYVGCINYDTREDAIKQAFLAFGPIRSITMSWDSMTGKHKGFAFVEFEQPEAAQLALEQMNGILVCSRNIKVGRPSQMPQAQACIDEIQKEAATFNRIYVSSIHKDLSDDDIRSVFSAFGTIKCCELSSAGIPGRHKGYGYIEYETLQSAQEAISSMNLFDLGGQYLRVGRAITPPDTRNLGLSTTPTAMPSASAVAAAAATAKIQAMNAVASNLGVDASKMNLEPKKEVKVEEKPVKRSSASQSRDSRPSRSPKREKQSQDREREKKSSTPQEEKPKAENGGGKAVVPPPALAPPPTIPATAFASTLQPGSGQVAAQHQAQQLELEKKLMDSGEPATLKQQEDMSIKGKSARHMVMQRLMGARSKLESHILLLKNMVGPEDVDEELQEEIQEECSKYGPVENVIMYQERQSEEDNAEIRVKIFVEFTNPEGVKGAKNALDGRFFAGRNVVALVYDQELYDQQDFSG